MRRVLVALLLVVSAVPVQDVAAASTVRCVAVIGDSTTRGTPGNHWPYFASLYSRWTFRNRARNGDFTSHMISRWSYHMSPLGPRCKYAIIAGGLNDIASGVIPLEVLKEHIVTLRELAIRDGMIPVVATITPASFDLWGEEVRQATNAWIRASFVYIDFAAITEDPANPGVTRNANDPRWFGASPDGIHYGPTARQAIGRAVARWFRGR
jgi:lysophospholipase L1-like esterase